MNIEEKMFSENIVIKDERNYEQRNQKDLKKT